MMRISIFIISLIFAVCGFAQTANQQSVIAGATVGHTHNPEMFIKSIQGDPKAGVKVYNRFCATCHAQDPVIDMGAPTIGVVKDWKVRMKIGVDGLLKVTENGVNNMPARGGCFECSDKMLKEAILYMLPKSLKKKKTA